MDWSDRMNRDGCQILLPSDRRLRPFVGRLWSEWSYWRSDIRVCLLVDNNDVLWKNIVVHLPNDGFLYVDEALLPVLANDRRNPRHMNDCSEGWAYLDKCLWPKPVPFEDFTRKWFGHDIGDQKTSTPDPLQQCEQCLRCP